MDSFKRAPLPPLILYRDRLPHVRSVVSLEARGHRQRGLNVAEGGSITGISIMTVSLASFVVNTCLLFFKDATFSADGIPAEDGVVGKKAPAIALKTSFMWLYYIKFSIF